MREWVRDGVGGEGERDSRRPRRHPQPTGGAELQGREGVSSFLLQDTPSASFCPIYRERLASFLLAIRFSITWLAAFESPELFCVPKKLRKTSRNLHVHIHSWACRLAHNLTPILSISLDLLHRRIVQCQSSQQHELCVVSLLAKCNDRSFVLKGCLGNNP